MPIFSEKKAIRTVEEDLWQLQKRVDQLESQAKIGKLEAAEVYDKTLRLMQRMAKRYEVDKKENGVAPDASESNFDSDGVDPISRAILDRRGIKRQAN